MDTDAVSEADAAPLTTGSRAPRTTLRPSGRTLEAILGAKIRAGRQALGLTAADLAARAGLSAGMLSKIEGGTISPSLGTIQSLAQTLGMPLASLFAGVEERLDCSHVVAGAGVVIDGRGTKAGHRYELLGQALRGEIEMEPFLITLTAEAESYTAFQHDGIEFIYMLSGRVRYRHANQSYLLEPGDSLFFDAGAPHGPEELIELPMTYLSIIAWPRHE